jgi:hypothetical protein
VTLLQKTLDEEKACDELLSGLAEDVNVAANAPAKEEEEEDAA